MTALLIFSSALIWVRVVMVGNDLCTLNTLFWNYLTIAFVLNALVLILYAMG